MCINPIKKEGKNNTRSKIVRSLKFLDLLLPRLQHYYKAKLIRSHTPWKTLTGNKDRKLMTKMLL